MSHKFLSIVETSLEMAVLYAMDKNSLLTKPLISHGTTHPIGRYK
ncbi:MAG: hypothetical protein ACTSU4_10415 [Promethearchaeota archaeon]